MAGRPTVGVEQLRSYRIVRTGLLRSSAVNRLGIWDLGIQDRDGSSRLALAVRVADPTTVPDQWPDPGAGDTDQVLVWSLRGAPHLHRRSDVAALAGRLRPVDEHRAAAELVGDAARLRSTGGDPLAAIDAVVSALRSVVTMPMTKGEASAAVTAAIPEQFAAACRSCGSTHVLEQLFRRSALPAGIGLVPDTKPVRLAPIRPAVRETRPTAQRSDLTPLVAAYYENFGAGSPADVAAFIGTSTDAVEGVLPDSLTTATVAGHRTLVTDDLLSSATDGADHAAGSAVRLLPTSDPLLAPRDRHVWTTEEPVRKELWPVIGSPGAVLAHTAIVGSWRTRLRGSRLTLTVSPFRRLGRTVLDRLRTEAELVAALRGAADVEVAVSD